MDYSPSYLGILHTVSARVAEIKQNVYSYVQCGNERFKVGMKYLTLLAVLTYAHKKVSDGRNSGAISSPLSCGYDNEHGILLIRPAVPFSEEAGEEVEVFELAQRP